jgi:hypothetical protein
MHSVKFVVALAIAASVACGKSDAEKQAEQAAEDIKKAAEAVTEAQAKGADTSKGMADMAKAMQGMAAAVGGGGTGDGKPVEPVATDALKTTLPTVAGWEMTAPKAQRLTSPVAFSQVEADFKQGGRAIELRVIDTGYAQLLVAPWSMFLTTGYSRESGDGFEKSTSVKGHPGFEKWDRSSRRGEVNVFVGKRFMVSVKGRELDNTQPLHEFISKVDFDKIAALK